MFAAGQGRQRFSHEILSDRFSLAQVLWLVNRAWWPPPGEMRRIPKAGKNRAREHMRALSNQTTASSRLVTDRMREGSTELCKAIAVDAMPAVNHV